MKAMQSATFDTDKGAVFSCYDLIQKLKLNDVEARFASAINGAESLQVLAQKVGVPLGDALLVVHRFQELEIVDFWGSGSLALPSGS